MFNLENIDPAKMQKAVIEQVLNSHGISMETYADFCKMQEDEKEDEDMKKKKSRNDMVGENQVGIMGVIISDGEAEMFEAFGMNSFVSPKSVMEALANCDGDIQVLIDSPGGSTWAMSDICDALAKYKKGKKHVMISGMSASAATIIMLEGDDIEISKYGKVMIHAPFAIVSGNGAKIANYGKHMIAMEGEFADAYAGKTKKDKEDMLALMHAETWFTAAEAVEIGLVDAISTDDMATSENDDDDDEEMVAKVTSAEAFENHNLMALYGGHKGVKLL